MNQDVIISNEPLPVGHGCRLTHTVSRSNDIVYPLSYVFICIRDEEGGCLCRRHEVGAAERGGRRAVLRDVVVSSRKVFHRRSHLSPETIL